MSDNTIGVLIIIFFIFMAIISGGDIFRPGNNDNATSTAERLRESPHYGPEAAEQYERDDAQRQLRLINAQIIDLNDEIQERIEEQNASVYRNRVDFNITNIGTFNEYATINVSNNEGEIIVLSGWKLKSLITGNEITIGGAANIPRYGQPSNAPLVISERRAKIIVGHDNPPIRESFRVNMCIGYLDENDRFEPSLPRICPRALEDAPAFSRTMDDDCLDYLGTLSRCEVPHERDYPEEINRSCEQYIEENLNYETCVERHQYDPEFFEPEWRINVPTRGILWLEERDVIQLIDERGRVVDTYRD